MRVHTILPVIILLVAGIYSQSKNINNEVELIDEFTRVSCCCDLGARAAGLAGILKERPDATAIVVNYPKAKYPSRLLFREEQIRATISYYDEIDPSRIRFIRGKPEATIRTQFWLIPNGAESPEIEEFPLDLKFEKNEKPFIFRAEYDADALEIPELCADAEYLSFNYIREILNQNPKARTNIVVFGKSKRILKLEKEKILELAEKYGVAQKRFRFFLKVENSRRTKTQPYVEAWLLP